MLFQEMMEPKLVEGVAKGKQFMRVACGANHFAALSLGAHSCTRDKAFACENETVSHHRSEGDLFVWGANDKGQLGLGEDTQPRTSPQVSL